MSRSKASKPLEFEMPSTPASMKLSCHDSWLQRTRLREFMNLPWPSLQTQSNLATHEQFDYVALHKAVPQADGSPVLLTPELVAQSFRLPLDGITEKEAAPFERDIDLIFPAKSKSDYKIASCRDAIAKRQYQFYVEMMQLLAKPHYMSKQNFALIRAAESGTHVAWAKVLHSNLLRVLQKTGGIVKIAGHLQQLYNVANPQLGSKTPTPLKGAGIAHRVVQEGTETTEQSGEICQSTMISDTTGTKKSPKSKKSEKEEKKEKKVLQFEKKLYDPVLKKMKMTPEEKEILTDTGNRLEQNTVNFSPGFLGKGVSWNDPFVHVMQSKESDMPASQHSLGKEVPYLSHVAIDLTYEPKTPFIQRPLTSNNVKDSLYHVYAYLEDMQKKMQTYETLQRQHEEAIGRLGQLELIRDIQARENIKLYNQCEEQKITIQKLQKQKHQIQDDKKQLEEEKKQLEMNNEQLDLQLREAEQKVLQAETDLASSKLAFKEAHTAINEAATVDRIKLVKAEARLAILTAKTQDSVEVYDAQVIEQWEEIAMGEMKKEWEDSLTRLHQYLNQVLPTCQLPHRAYSGDKDIQNDKAKNSCACAAALGTGEDAGTAGRTTGADESNRQDGTEGCNNV